MWTNLNVVAKHLADLAPGQVAHVVVVTRVLAPKTQPRPHRLGVAKVGHDLGIEYMDFGNHLARSVSVHVWFLGNVSKKACLPIF